MTADLAGRRRSAVAHALRRGARIKIGETCVSAPRAPCVHLNSVPVPKLRGASSVESGRRNPQVTIAGLEEPAGERLDGCIDTPLLMYISSKPFTCGMNRAGSTT